MQDTVMCVSHVSPVSPCLCLLLQLLGLDGRVDRPVWVFFLLARMGAGAGHTRVESFHEEEDRLGICNCLVPPFALPLEEAAVVIVLGCSQKG